MGRAFRGGPLFRSTRCRISSRQLRCSARQFRSHSSPLNRGWPHQQKRCLQEQPVQPRSNSHRKDRDENQNRKFQRGDHDVPPNLRFKEWHAHDQSHHVVNKGLTVRGSLSLCVDEYTLCRSAPRQRRKWRGRRRTGRHYRTHFTAVSCVEGNGLADALDSPANWLGPG